ncbi:MAG: enoyl-CoA hydratase/carnithine racemase [Gammaproteobacteria bacterium]|jgi:enoyl-CoA hydratase/carnithine racemase
MSEPFLLSEKNNSGVVILTMNRPDALNALTERRYFEEFSEGLGAAQADKSVRCIILTGAGRAFCAGGNIKDMRDHEGLFAGSPLELRDTYAEGVHLAARAFEQLDVPVIAAVNGAAIGSGCGLACLSDFRIACDTATFGIAFVKLGIIPGDGSAWILPRIVGVEKAMEMALTGDPIDAHAALACGLVSKVTTADKLMPCAHALAERIAANPPHAVRITKRLIREGQHSDLHTSLQMAAAYQPLAHAADDHREALAAFFAKRPGVYQGR